MAEKKTDGAAAQDWLRRVRAYCLSFPGAGERLSHGAPTFFIDGKRSFAQFHNNHHGDGKLALWCAASADIQSVLVQSEPDVYFVPAYVGYLGWVGMRLDRGAAWEAVALTLKEAYLAKAPKKYREAAMQTQEQGNAE